MGDAGSGDVAKRSDRAIGPAAAVRRTRRTLLYLEFIVCYFVVPALPLFGVPPRVFVPLFLACICWLTIVALYDRRMRHRADRAMPATERPTRAHARVTMQREGLTLLAFIAVSTLIVWRVSPELLFRAPREQPLRWLQFWFIYGAFSVPPQEALFRVVFFRRYRRLWGDRRWIGLSLNAVSFSIAHAILHHWLVYVLTFLGGYVFAVHWLRSRNFATLWLLHAAYGLWLFTVGLGPVFGFPF